jgi:hypothetical protein
MAEAGIKRGPNLRRLRRLLNKIEKTMAAPEAAEGILSNIGLFLHGRVIRGILTGRPGDTRLRPNRPATIARKGSSKVLIDTGNLVRKILVIPRKQGQVPAVFVGAPGRLPSGDPRRNIGRVAGYAEFGTVTMLPREFLKPVLDKNIGEIRAILIGDLGRKMGVIGPQPF